MDESPAPPLDPRVSARRQRWVMLGVFLFLLLLLFGAFRVWVVKRVHAELQVIRERGEPVELEDLSKWLVGLTEEQRQAPEVYQKALRDFEITEEEHRSPLPVFGFTFKMPGANEPLPPESRQAGEKLLNKLAGVLSDLRRAVRQGPIALDWRARTSLVDQTIAAAQLLELDAIIAVELDDAERVVRAIEDIEMLSRRMVEGPCTYIDALSASAVRGIPTYVLARAIHRTRFTDEQLSRLAEAFVDPDEQLLSRAQTLERVRYFQMFPEALEAGGKVFEKPAARPKAIAYFLSGLYDLDRAAYLAYSQRVIDAFQLPMPERLEVIRKLGLPSHGLNSVYTLITDELVGSGNHRLVVLKARGLPITRLARTALAVERFRLAGGGLPEKLEDLAPRFLDGVPEDPYTGKPLVYKKLDKGYLLYSLGEDGADNGGLDRNPPGKMYDPGSDITFSVTR